MRILLVNKFIFPKGGAETYTFDVGKMLEEHGHEVQYNWIYINLFYYIVLLAI